jgi:hypothetical protein
MTTPAQKVKKLTKTVMIEKNRLTSLKRQLTFFAGDPVHRQAIANQERVVQGFEAELAQAVKEALEWSRD